MKGSRERNSRRPIRRSIYSTFTSSDAPAAESAGWRLGGVFCPSRKYLGRGNALVSNGERAAIGRGDDLVDGKAGGPGDGGVEAADGHVFVRRFRAEFVAGAV